MATIVITGANRGIGLELARQRAEDHDVIAVCREANEALHDIGVHIEEGIDVTDGAAVTDLASRLSDRTIDVLVNNAGILGMGGLDALDYDSILRQLEVNSVGPLRVSAAFAPRMKTGSKIAIVTSRMGSIGDSSSGGMYGYRMSKAAVNMAGVSLALDLKPRGIAVAILHPGFVKTRMTGGNGNFTAEESAGLLWQRIDALSVETSGSFWHANGEQLDW